MRSRNARTRAAAAGIAAIPVVMLTLAVPLVNRSGIQVGPVPLLPLWIAFWVFAAPAALSIVARLERP